MALAGLTSPLFLVALSAGFYFFSVEPPVMALAFGLAAVFEPMGMWTVQVVMRQRAYDGQFSDLDGYDPPAEDRPRFSPTFITLAAAGGVAAVGLFAAGLLLSESGAPGADAPLYGLWLMAGIGTALYALAALRPVDTG
jgi:hypothetical protein